MNTEDLLHYFASAFGWAAMICGGIALGGFLLLCVLGALTGAGESGSGEEIGFNDGEEGDK